MCRNITIIILNIQKQNNDVLQDTGNNLPLNNKTSTVLEPQPPILSKSQTQTKPADVKDEKPTLEQVLAEMKELRMEMELFKTRHE